MIDAPLIKINSDSPEKIAELYGIGFTLAKRIVDHRESVGHFRTPDDLAQVNGINRDLATTLAPHIDWELPLPAEQPQKLDWFSILTGILFIIFFTEILRKNVLPSLIISSQNYHNGNTPFAWTDVWVDVSKMVLGGCLILIAILVLLNGLISSPIQARKFFRISIFCAVAGILSGVSILLARTIKYQHYLPNGWSSYFSESSHLAAFFVIVPAFVLITPIFLVVIWPKLRTNTQLARAVDFIMVIAAPLLAIIIWAVRDTFPTGYLLMMGIYGVYIGYTGLEILRTGKSFFASLVYDILDPKTLRQLNLGTNGWLAWINARLPDPEQQKALKKALDEAYPKSKWQTISGAIILGAGGWIVLTALSAVIQWVVEKGLNTLWP